MIRRLLPFALAMLVTSCGGESSPISPSPPPTAVVSLSGTVSSTSGQRLSGASVRFLDGPNGTRSTTANSNGEYRFDGITAGNANLAASAGGHHEDRRGISILGVTSLNFSLAPAPLWTHTGSGNSVFDMPTTVARVHIRAVWSGSGTSNFIVRIAGRGVVNEILRNLSNRTYEGTHLVTGGVVEIVDSGNISPWVFTEVR